MLVIEQGIGWNVLTMWFGGVLLRGTRRPVTVQYEVWSTMYLGLTVLCCVDGVLLKVAGRPVKVKLEVWSPVC